MSGTQRGSCMEDGHAGRSASLPVDDVLLAPSPAAPLPARQVVCSDRRGHVDAEGFALNCKLPAMGRRQDHADGTPIGSATCRCATTFSRLEAEQRCSSGGRRFGASRPFSDDGQAGELLQFGRPRTDVCNQTQKPDLFTTGLVQTVGQRLPGDPSIQNARRVRRRSTENEPAPKAAISMAPALQNIELYTAFS